MHEQPIDLLDELKAMQAMQTAGKPFALGLYRHLSAWTSLGVADKDYAGS